MIEILYHILDDGRRIILEIGNDGIRLSAKFIAYGLKLTCYYTGTSDIGRMGSLDKGKLGAIVIYNMVSVSPEELWLGLCGRKGGINS